MFKIVRKKKALLPAVTLPKVLMEDIAEKASTGIVDNIMLQKQASGATLKRNARSTRLLKQAKNKGKPVLSLVDEEHRFVQTQGESWSWRLSGFGKRKRIIIRPRTGELATLNRYVQEKGYVGWFDISAKTEAAIRKLIRDWLTLLFKQSVGGEKADIRAAMQAQRMNAKASNAERKLQRRGVSNKAKKGRQAERLKKKASLAKGKAQSQALRARLAEQRRAATKRAKAKKKR